MIVDQHHAGRPGGPVAARRSSPPSVGGGACAAGPAAARAIVSVTLVPSPGVDCTVASPPCLLIRPRMDSATPLRSPAPRPGRSPCRGPDRDRDLIRLDLGEHRDHAAPDHLAAFTVASLAAASSALRCSSSGQSPTVTTSTGTPCLRLDVPLDLPDPLGERGHLGVTGGAPLEQPGAQLALLRAGELHDRLRVVGAALDERERLQHRVVHPGGDVGPLLRPRPRLPLEQQVAGDPQPPGAEQHHDAGRHEQEAAERREQVSAAVQAEQPAEPAASSTAAPASRSLVARREAAAPRPEALKRLRPGAASPPARPPARSAR